MSLTMTEAAFRNIRRGIAIICTVAILAVLAWWLLTSGTTQRHYAAIVSDASELVADNAVRLNDVQVGTVKSIKLDGLHARVEFAVDDDVVLPRDTRVEVRETSLLGELYVALVPEGDGRLPDDATIPLDRTRRVPQLEQVVGLGSELVDQVTVDSLNKVIHAFDGAFGDNPERMGRFLDSMAAATAAFDAHRDDLAATIDRVEQMAGALAPHTDELSGSISQFLSGVRALDNQKEKLAAFTAGLSEMSTAAADILTRHEGKLSIAAVQARQVLDEVVGNLDHLEKGLQALPDFTTGWNCVVQGHYIQFLAGVYPEVARVDAGAGHCTPEEGPRGRQESGQVQFEPQRFERPSGTAAGRDGGLSSFMWALAGAPR